MHLTLLTLNYFMIYWKIIFHYDILHKSDWYFPPSDSDMASLVYDMMK